MTDTPRSHYRRYTNRERKTLLLEFHETPYASDLNFCQVKGIPRSTWRTWRAKETKIIQPRRDGRRPTLGGQGKKTIIPFQDNLFTFTRAWREEERYLRVYHMMNWIKRNQKPWLEQYIQAKKSEATAYDSLGRLLRRLFERHRYTQRVPCPSRVLQCVLDEVWLGYAALFWSKYSQYPSRKTYAEISKSSKVNKTSKHSERNTVVLTIRADGGKLPFLFIVKGLPGGVIESRELQAYSAPHAYAVGQENAWMNDRVWCLYMRQVLTSSVHDSSVLLVDNLECHNTLRAVA
ncbi:hypothetical protein LEN26_007349 [Aphanomyces euteiches]|nr:hypothetical protein LEN26_007349 [Aphanomyces euteiches]